MMSGVVLWPKKLLSCHCTLLVDQVACCQCYGGSLAKHFHWRFWPCWTTIEAGRSMRPLIEQLLCEPTGAACVGVNHGLTKGTTFAIASLGDMSGKGHWPTNYELTFANMKISAHSGAHEGKSDLEVLEFAGFRIWCVARSFAKVV